MSKTTENATTEHWGGEVAVETIRGVPYRLYSQRPHRVESVLAFAARWADRAHIIQGGRSIGFGAIRAAALAKAQQLRATGIGHGARVFLLGWNSPEWVVNFWACVQAGAVPVLANGWWSEAELSDALGALQPALTLADPQSASRMPAEARLGPWEADFTAAQDSAISANSQDEEAPAVIIFTSGTEGRPKAVVLSHRALLAGLQMLLHVTRRLPHQVPADAIDIGLHTGPFFHVGGVQTLLRAMAVGGTLVLPEGRYDAAQALELIERHKVSRWAAVPTMVSRLLEHPDVQRRDLSSLRSVTIGGAPVHLELMQRVAATLPSVDARIPTGYGLTENGGQATAASGAQTAERPGSSGRPLPCVELSFEQRPGLPDGEILVRSPTQMSGYYGMADSPIDAQGWLHTGDLGHLDDKGNLWITGRCKDLIIRGGENIAPVAVERALVTVPGVSEVAVFGVPHPDLGEEVMAVVALERDLDEASLKEALRGKLSSFAIPSRWKLQREPLPVNHAGKIDKAAVAAAARAALLKPGN